MIVRRLYQLNKFTKLTPFPKIASLKNFSETITDNIHNIEPKEPRKYLQIATHKPGLEFKFFGIRYLILYPTFIYIVYKGIRNLFSEHYIWSLLYAFGAMILKAVLNDHKRSAWLIIKEAGLVKENGKVMLQLVLVSGDTNLYELSSVNETDLSKIPFGRESHGVTIEGKLYLFPRAIDVHDETLLTTLEKGTIKEYVELNKII
jgi:hypothetical protein